MDKIKSNHFVHQLVVGFILTLLTAIYTLMLLADSLVDQGAVKVLILSIGSLFLIVIDLYIGYQIIRVIKNSNNELEDS